jgi:hypothetical protein
MEVTEQLRLTKVQPVLKIPQLIGMHSQATQYCFLALAGWTAAAAALLTLLKLSFSCSRVHSKLSWWGLKLLAVTCRT